MTQIKNYNYSLTDITAMVSDITNGEYLWVAFSLNSDNECLLRKVSAHDPLQLYYQLNLSVNNISSLHIFGSYIFASVSHASYIAYRISLNSPVSSNTGINIPSGINEVPIDIKDDGTYLFMLTPGNISGENAKILKYTSTGTYITTIDLTTVFGAKSFTIDDNGDLWVITYDNPSDLVRVTEISGGNYSITTTTLE